MSRVLVLGIGSPAGDDQAGWHVVDALKGMDMARRNDLVIDKLDRPGANLALQWQQADHVILVDAMQATGTPGEIRRYTREDWPEYQGGISSHGLGVLDALRLAEAMEGLPERLDLYGIEIGSADPLDEPGDTVLQAARKLAAEIAARLR